MWHSRLRHCVCLAVLLAAAPTAGQPPGGDPAGRLYASAAALQNRQAYDLAADEWTEFLNDFGKDPRADRAWHYLGVCRLKTKEYAAAAAAFKNVVEYFPQSPLAETSQFYLGMTYYNQAQAGEASKYDAATAAFDVVLQKWPKGASAPQARFYQGEVLYAQKKLPAAAAKYAELLKNHPEHAVVSDALYALGVAEQDQGNHAEASARLAELLKRFPQTPLAAEAHLRRGEAEFSLDRLAEAEKAFAAAAAAKSPLADKAALRQAATIARGRRFAEAAAIYARFDERFPQSPQRSTAWLAGGECYFLAGEYAKAKPLLEKALADPEKAAEAAHWLARTLLKENKPAESAAVAERALKAAGDAEQLLLDRADALYELPPRRREAIDLYRSIAEKHAGGKVAEQALYMAAFGALEQGDHGRAASLAEEYERRHPEGEYAADVLHILAEARLQAGKWGDARGNYERLLTRFAAHAEAEAWRLRSALASYLQKDYAATVKYLEDALPKLRSPEAVAEAKYLLGSSRLELGRAVEAVADLKASQAAAPRWRQADETLLALAAAQRKAGDKQAAAATLDRLLAEFGTSGAAPRAYYRRGEYAYLDGAYEAAAADYQRLLDRWPRDELAPFALHGLAWSRLNLKRYAAVAPVADELLRRFGNHQLAGRTRLARGMARQQLGQFAAAVDDLKAVLAAAPAAAEQADARYVLALCQVGLKKYTEAAATLRALLVDQPQYADADKVLYELGWALKAGGKPKDAAAAFLKLGADWPKSPLAADSLYQAAEHAYDSGDFAAAADRFAKARDAASALPADPARDGLAEKAAHKLGWAHFRAGDFAKAAAAFAAERAAWPKGALAADALFMQAESLFKLEQYDAALPLYLEVKGAAGKDVDVLARLHAGQAAAQLKQWERSLEILAAAARQFADSAWLPEILYEQGWAEQNLGELKKAAALYEQVVAKTDREVAARAQFMIGEIQFQQKEHAEAVKSFFKTAYGYGYPVWQSAATYEAARCFEILKKPSQAIKQYEELVEKFPQSEKAPLARQRLDELRRADAR